MSIAFFDSFPNQTVFVRYLKCISNLKIGDLVDYYITKSPMTYGAKRCFGGTYIATATVVKLLPPSNNLFQPGRPSHLKPTKLLIPSVLIANNHLSLNDRNSYDLSGFTEYTRTYYIDAGIKLFSIRKRS